MGNSIFGPKFKRDLLQRVLKDLFGETQQYFRQREDALCRQHKQLTQGEAVFTYRGKVFLHNKVLDRPGGHFKALPLHPSLREEADEYLDAKRKFDDEEQAVIQQYLTNALNICETPGDLLMVLPEQTHQAFLPYIEKFLDKYPATLTEARAARFREDYRHYDAAFKERLLTNLLMR